MRCWIGGSDMTKHDKGHYLQNLKSIAESILKDITNIEKEEGYRHSLGMNYLENDCEIARMRIDEFLKARGDGRI